MSAKSQLEFMRWLKVNHPMLYQRAMDKARSGSMGFLGQDEAETKPSFWSRFSDAALSLGTTYLTVKNQQDILDLNIKRAEQGMPPIDASAGTPTIKVALPPDAVQQVTREAGLGLNKILLFSALMLGSFFLIRNR